MKKMLFFVFFLLFSLLAGSFFYLFEYDWVDFSHLECFSPAKPSILLDDEGNEFARFQLDKRAIITFDDLPDHLVKAFVAAEDHNFFDHYGISIRGIIRSLLVNIYHGRVVQGASTITQQLARLMFLSSKRRYLRKIQEVFLSFQIERHFTKKQILELYVNNVYFGQGIYGAKAACRRFWNKSVLDITLAEAATLASVAKSALLYSPVNSPQNSRRRRNIILSSMRKLDFISFEQYKDAFSQELIVEDYISGDSIRLYIQERIRQWAEKKWGKEVLYKQGLKIQTTINRRKQELAEELFCKKIHELRPKVGDSLNGGMISMESNTGKIKACIGGYNFRESQFNRAFQAVRQMGSSFKPIVYTAALLAGIGMETVMVDEPIEMRFPGWNKVWKPKNWTRRFEGPMTLARALSYSNNIITIKTLLKTGVENVINVARAFGLKRELLKYPSLALGTAETTVKESVAAFNVFANNGTYVEPYLVEWVRDEWEKKLWEHKSYEKRILGSKINSKMVKTLSLRLEKTKKVIGGKGWIKSEVIGKTGSTNEAVSTWYVGATPELTTAVYLGRDDNKPMGKYIFGYQTAYPIWLEFYKKLHFTKKQFYRDPELKEFSIDWVSGYETDNLKSSRTVTLLK